MITIDIIRKLTDFKSDDSLIVSFYLNVDGAKLPRKQDLEVDLRALVRKVEKDWVYTNKLNHRRKRYLELDLARIAQFVRYEFSRNQTRGLAIFSCQERNLWQIYKTPVPLPSMVVVGSEPYAKTLTTVLDQFHRYCTVLVDRRKSRIFAVYLGDIEEHFGIFEDDVPSRVSEGEWAGLRQTKIAHHIEDHVLRHLKNVANKTLIFFRMHDFDRLVIGGHKEIIPKFKEVLHPYLRERVVGQFLAEPDLPLKIVLQQSLKCEAEVERRRESELIQKITDAENPGGVGVIGIEPTIEALMLGQVNTLVIAAGLSLEGRICEEHHFVSTYLDGCPICARPLSEREDIVEEMVQLAIKQNCRLKYILYHREFIGRDKIGALLRFAV